MSQHVTCPKCNHQFEVDDLSDRYEKYIARTAGGTLMPKGTPIIDVIGPNGETYQVKSARARVGNVFEFKFTANHIEPDFAALFGIIKRERFLFLLPYKEVKRRASVMKDSRNHRQVDRIRLVASANNSSWIWDYRVLPKNFIARVAELKAIEQLTMQFTKGLGDA